MLVLALKVRRTPLVCPYTEFGELRNSHSQRREYSLQPRILSSAWCTRNPLQEIAPIGILLSAHITVGFAHQLWYEVVVADRSEEICNVTELQVRVHLLYV